MSKEQKPSVQPKRSIKMGKWLNKKDLKTLGATQKLIKKSKDHDRMIINTEPTRD